jgi:5-methylcytosine-specific restriction protein A
MTLSDLTAAAVRRALVQFRELGRKAFLERYGFKEARVYFVVDNGYRCDSKAIAGAAHGFLQGREPLGPNDFSGGERTVAKRLRELGFVVTGPEDTVPASITFEPGKLYSRRRDIHELFGGQQQGGICTPQGVPFIFLFTGESGGQFGYRDGPQDDGTFAYTGEGQRGDMEFVRGNRAIRDHVADGKDLLLFEATGRGGMYRFVGCYACGGWTNKSSPDRDGSSRAVIIFRLVPNSADIAPPADAAPEGASLDELRTAAYAAAATPSQPPQDARRNFFERSAAVKAYVLGRARGRCEACGREAPFCRKDGSPYLEPHHTKRVADGGPDHPAWVGAVCPTCHREIHYGQDGAARNKSLQLYLNNIEAEPRSSDNSIPGAP